MLPLPRLLLVTLLLVGFAVSPGGAQAQVLAPVDQGVADLDPLATSFRQVQTGLMTVGEQTALFRVVPTGPAASVAAIPMQPPIYYRIAPGFRAQLTRMDYLVMTADGTYGYDVAGRVDNQYVEVVPPGVIYDLRPYTAPTLPGQGPAANAIPPAPPAPANRATPFLGGQILPMRLNYQINNRIQAGQINNAVPTPGAPASSP